MSTKYILIVLGEPNSTFSEIIGKYFKKVKKFKKKIIIIGNKNLLIKQLNLLKLRFSINEINNYTEAKQNKTFSNLSSNSSKYIENSFKKSLEIINKKKNRFILINGPVSKKTFLKKRFYGITEYLSNKTNSNNEIMLIYNKKLSVSPLTTHIPIKYVNKKINKKKIVNNILSIKKFYNKILKEKMNCAVLGLNPHCESIDRFSEEDKIIDPSINYLKKKGVKVDGPFSTDTFFLQKNLRKYNVVLGMYHDQVLTPIKTLFNFEAINITIGLPFIRISPDHGPNTSMLGKNKSDPASFFYAMKFAEKLR